VFNVTLALPDNAQNAIRTFILTAGIAWPAHLAALVNGALVDVHRPQTGTLFAKVVAAWPLVPLVTILFLQRVVPHMHGIMVAENAKTVLTVPDHAPNHGVYAVDPRLILTRLKGVA